MVRTLAALHVRAVEKALSRIILKVCTCTPWTHMHSATSQRPTRSDKRPESGTLFSRRAAVIPIDPRSARYHRINLLHHLLLLILGLREHVPPKLDPLRVGHLAVVLSCSHETETAPPNCSSSGVHTSRLISPRPRRPPSSWPKTKIAPPSTFTML